MPFFPGPGIGGHCLPNDLSILKYNYDEQKEPSPIINAVSYETGAMPEILFKRIEKFLPDKKNRDEVLLVGVGFKPGSAELTQTPATQLIRLLEKEGIATAYVDSRVPYFEVDGKTIKRIKVEAITVKRFRLAIILNGDNALDLNALTENVDVVFDASGGRAPGVDRVSCYQL
jgi:UDP-N-acetyl-D-mannosaminuronate dehydrogenase